MLVNSRELNAAVLATAELHIAQVIELCHKWEMRLNVALDQGICSVTALPESDHESWLHFIGL